MDTIERNKIDHEKALSLLQNRKPCFETSNSKIFVQLHKAASQKAANVLKINPDDPNINQFIINTGMSEDGRYISNEQQKSDEKDVGKFFRVGNRKYEIGIVLQFTDYKAPLNKDLKDKNNLLKEILKYNESKGTLKEFKNLIFNGIREYCKWFWGETYNVSDSDLTEFIPDYDGEKVQVVGGEIKSMSTDEMVEYLMNRTTGGHEEVKARQATKDEQIKVVKKENGIPKKERVEVKKGQWIVDDNTVMDDVDFKNTYEAVKNGVYKKKEQDNPEKEAGNHTKPRLGYKIGYEIEYK